MCDYNWAISIDLEVFVLSGKLGIHEQIRYLRYTSGNHITCNRCDVPEGNDTSTNTTQLLSRVGTRPIQWMCHGITPQSFIPGDRFSIAVGAKRRRGGGYL